MSNKVQKKKEKQKSFEESDDKANGHKYNTEICVPVQTYLKAAGNKTLTQH